jgi:hypothetical protein
MGGGSGHVYVSYLAYFEMVDDASGNYTSLPGVAKAFPSPGPVAGFGGGKAGYSTAGTVQVACGKLLGNLVTSSTELSYEGWTQDAFESGHLTDVEETGEGCWALFNDSADGNSDSGPFHLAHIGSTGVDARSPELPGVVKALNGDMWLVRSARGAENLVLQRLDPDSWQLQGVPWSLPTACSTFSMFGSGGAVWCPSSDTVVRLDLPLTGAAPSPSPSPSPSVTPEPSSEPTSSPSASPTEPPAS